MWTFLRTARIERHFGQWFALVTLSKVGAAEESFFVKFGTLEPSPDQVDAAGEALALRKNLEEAAPAPNDAMTREEFLSRFTNEEIAAIYRAAQVDDNVFAYVKKMEINPVIRRSAPDTRAGLSKLESAGLLQPGRTNEILR